MIEILPPLGKYKYDNWRILPVMCYIDNFVCFRSYIRNINTLGCHFHLKHRLNPPINTPYSSRQKVWKKWGLASYSAPKFILGRVERGKVLRARGLPGLLGVLRVARAQKLYQNPFGFDEVFQALVRSITGALLEFCEFWQRTISQVPLVYWSPGLLGLSYDIT
jgi:hypothetical protein